MHIGSTWTSGDKQKLTIAKIFSGLSRIETLRDGGSTEDDRGLQRPFHLAVPETFSASQSSTRAASGLQLEAINKLPTTGSL